MGHSFTVTSDTDVLIWCNELQVSFKDIHCNTSYEKNLNFFSKIYTMYIEILYTYYYKFMYNFNNVFQIYIKLIKLLLTLYIIQRCIPLLNIFHTL